jgi:hypothetical protein
MSSKYKLLFVLSGIIFIVGMLFSYSIPLMDPPVAEYLVSIGVILVNIKIYFIGVILIIISLALFNRVLECSEITKNLKLVLYGVLFVLGVVFIFIEPFPTDTNVTTSVAGDVIFQSFYASLGVIRYAILTIFGALGFVKESIQ